jgi:hypothetical protein
MARVRASFDRQGLMSTLGVDVLNIEPGRVSVVAERRDQLGLRHRGPALDADLASALDQVILGPVVVGRALPPVGPDLLP